MVDFRKWFPALAVVALFVGSATTAIAQPAFTCATVAGVPPVVRGEGVAELVGDVVLNCTGGTVTAAGAQVPLVNISVFLNTNITSRILETSTGLTEALLLIDEPRPAQQNTCVPTAPATTCPAVGTGLGGVIDSNGIQQPGGVQYRDGVVDNVYQGRLIQEAGTNRQFLSWLGVPIDPPGTVGTRVLRITNIRANAAGVGIATTFVPNQIFAFVSITSTQPLALNNPQQTIGFPIRGLASFSTVGNPTFLRCNEYTVASGVSLRARFVEGFASSFKPRGLASSFGDQIALTQGGPSSVALPQGGLAVAGPGGAGGINVGSPIVTGATGGTTVYTGPPAFNTPLNVPAGVSIFSNPFPGYTAGAAVSATVAAQNIPGQSVFTETGFYNPAFAGTYATAGLATQGTRLILRMTNIPTGVTLYAGVYESATSTTSTNAQTSRVVLISGADANGAGGTPATGSSVTGAPSSFGGALSTVSVTNGAATLVYEVATSDPTQIETIDIPLFVTFAANSAALTPANALPTITGALAPISTTNQASATAPVPRFVDLPQTGTGFNVVPCRTNLLFPFVTNQFGFDTGLAISNTSRDIFGTTPQSGPCAINYFGCTLAQGGCTGAAPAAQTSASVAAGSTFTFTVSLGAGPDSPLVTGAQAFSGYIIAQCDFQYAHGFAFITDGPIGTARVAEGYLALVMDESVGTRTGMVSETLNN